MLPFAPPPPPHSQIMGGGLPHIPPPLFLRLCNIVEILLIPRSVFKTFGKPNNDMTKVRIVSDLRIKRRVPPTEWVQYTLYLYLYQRIVAKLLHVT